MPTSLHLILVHGWQVIDQLFLPIGKLSEEALEALHKRFADFRQNHAMKDNV